MEHNPKKIDHLDWQPGLRTRLAKWRMTRRELKIFQTWEERNQHLAVIAMAATIVLGTVSSEHYIGEKIINDKKDNARKLEQGYSRCLNLIADGKTNATDTVVVNLKDLTGQQLKDCGFGDVQYEVNSAIDKSQSDLGGVVDYSIVNPIIELPDSLDVVYALEDQNAIAESPHLQERLGFWGLFFTLSTGSVAGSYLLTKRLSRANKDKKDQQDIA